MSGNIIIALMYHHHKLFTLFSYYKRFVQLNLILCVRNEKTKHMTGDSNSDPSSILSSSP
jgi:hypothetical protein